MRVLALADEADKRLWDHLDRSLLEGVDLILSAGDLPADYLSFLTCFTHAPIYYIHGNHDVRYEKKPPEGCICIEDTIVKIGGVRILGLGGSMRYKPGDCMYSEKEMQKRIRKLWFELFVNRGFTESEKPNNHFAKLIHDSGMTLTRLAPLPRHFFLMIEPEEGVLSQIESLDSLQKVFELFADKDILRIICYIYSLPFMPVAASLISKHTGLAEEKVESYMERICDMHLAERTVIATADGEMNSYTVRPEGFAVPLLCFADEIAKDDLSPFFGAHDRKKPFFNS